MSELVEKLAKALVAADEQNGGPPWDYVVGLGKHAISARMDQARACLSAIEDAGLVIVPREPTEEMVRCGFGQNSVRIDTDHPVSRVTHDPTPAYRAMIAAAPKLAKPPTPSATGK